MARTKQIGDYLPYLKKKIATMQFLFIISIYIIYYCPKFHFSRETRNRGFIDVGALFRVHQAALSVEFLIRMFKANWLYAGAKARIQQAIHCAGVPFCIWYKPLLFELVVSVYISCHSPACCRLLCL